MRISATVIPEIILRRMPEQERRRYGKAGLSISEIESKNGRKLEREIQAEIAQYLRLHGTPFFVQRMDRKTSGTVGWPDFSFVLKGRACFLEVKRPGQKPDPDQEKIMADLIASGAFVRVVHSLQEAIAAFQEISG